MKLLNTKVDTACSRRSMYKYGCTLQPKWRCFFQPPLGQLCWHSQPTLSWDQWPIINEMLLGVEDVFWGHRPPNPLGWPKSRVNKTKVMNPIPSWQAVPSANQQILCLAAWQTGQEQVWINSGQPLPPQEKQLHAYAWLTVLYVSQLKFWDTQIHALEIWNLTFFCLSNETLGYQLFCKMPPEVFLNSSVWTKQLKIKVTANVGDLMELFELMLLESIFKLQMVAPESSKSFGLKWSSDIWAFWVITAWGQEVCVRTTLKDMLQPIPWTDVLLIHAHNQ